MRLQFFQVDAFTSRLFGGNPAAVCVLDQWLPEAVMQNIALENNLPETAFFVPSPDPAYDYHLRWFTPTVEMDLCGHATLAAGYCIFEHLGFTKNTIRFQSRSGLLTVTKNPTGYMLDFPVWSYEESLDVSHIENILGLKVQKVLFSKATFAILDSVDLVENFKPDLAKINTLENTIGLVISARGEGSTDFVSRFFCPQIGIPEDPVTGAIHCALTPYWSNILGKTAMNARQLSAREGDLFLELKNDRVLISGQAVLYLKGEINI